MLGISTTRHHDTVTTRGWVRRTAVPILVAVLAIGFAACSKSGADAVAGESGQTSEYQRKLLENGVTYDEFEQAVLATMACLEDHGVPTFGPYPEQGGKSLSFDLGNLPLNATDEQFTAQERIVQECTSEYSDVVADVYAQSILPTEAETQEREEKRRACARELGFDVPDDMDTGEFYMLVWENRSELGECLKLYP
jgi:hypothetical protein